jgi:ionotropic glutamate receptor
MFIIILTSFYTANLTAFLTLSRFTLPIEEARELAYDELRWVGQAGGALEHAITVSSAVVLLLWFKTEAFTYFDRKKTNYRI